MSFPQSPITSKSVLLPWIAASAAGFAAGLVGGLILTAIAAEMLPGVNADRFGLYATLFCLGLAVGVAQLTVMAHLLPTATRWMAATLLGYLLAMIPFAISGFLNLAGPELLDDAFLLALMGAAIGLAQWWVLRQHYRGAVGWVLASMVGFLSFLWLVANPAHSLPEFVLVGTVLGGLAAVASGAVLAWLVQRPRAAITS
jgi:uncharacterized membrane protein